jgi:hypothetical protein
MNQLSSSNYQRAISQMPLQYAELILARFEGIKITEIPYEESVILVKSKIVNCIRSIGHYAEANDEGVLNFLTKNLISEIIKNRKNLTDKELDLILINGAKGQYKRKKDEFIACNLLSINLWIDSYFDDTLRKMALIDFNTRLSLDVPKKELTDQEIENIIKNGCITAYEGFLKDGSLPYSTKPIYDRLKKEFNIVWSDEERTQINKEAELIYKSKLKSEFKKVGETEEGLKLVKIKTALKYYFNKIKNKVSINQFKDSLVGEVR